MNLTVELERDLLGEVMEQNAKEYTGHKRPVEGGEPYNEECSQKKQIKTV